MSTPTMVTMAKPWRSPNESTIVAMSPLAVLSLGDLQGFAIVTIVGVLIGVLITRPAYGNVLRRLVTDG